MARSVQRRAILPRFDSEGKKGVFRYKNPPIGWTLFIGCLLGPTRGERSSMLSHGKLSVNVCLTESHIASISAQVLGGTHMSANEAQNVATIQRGFEAFAKGDVETLKTLFSANANWNQAETGVLRGNYRGVHAILEFFGQLAHETQGSLRAEPMTIAASGDEVLVFERVTGKRKGKTLDTKEVLVFKLDNGIVTEVTELQSDYPTVAAFWS